MSRVQGVHSGNSEAPRSRLLHVCREETNAPKEACFARRGAKRHYNSTHIVFIHMLIRLGRSFNHSCEQALMNTNVWIAQQLLIIPLRGIIQLDGIIGTQRTETLGSGLPMVHTGMTVWQSWQSIAEAFCQDPVWATSTPMAMLSLHRVGYTVFFLKKIYFFGSRTY